MKQLLITLCLMTVLLHSQGRNPLFLSVPESCSVSINGTPWGTTPFRAELPDSISSRPAVIHFSRTGYIPQTQQCASFSDTVVGRLSFASSLRITSVPESASVFIGGIFYGRAPITIDTIAARPLSVTIVKQKYYPYKIDVTAIERQQIVLTPQLQKFSTYLSVTTNLTDAEILLDDALIGTGAVDSVDANIGGHVLSVRDPASGIRTDRNFSVNSIGTKKFHADLRYFSSAKLTYGIVIPGLAQCVDGTLLTGAVFLGAGTLSMVNLIKANSRYGDKMGSYDVARKGYDEATSEQTAASARTRLLSAHQDLERSLKEFNTAALITAVIWTLNGLDVLFHHTLDDTIIEQTGHGPFTSVMRNDLRSISVNYSVTF